MHVRRNILGLGTIVVDLQMIVDAYPQRDSKVEAARARTQIGGPVPTAVVALARLGHRCRFHGVWGADAHGDLIEADLQSENVEFARHESASGTGVAHVWVESDSGHRTVVCHRAIPDGDVPCLTTADLVGFDLLHLDGWPDTSALHAAQDMKSRGGMVALDTGTPKPETAAILTLADIVNAPRHAARALTGNDDIEAAGRDLLSRGPQMVTITDGERGAWIFSAAGSWFQPAFPVTAVDTNGAGDVFSGGLIHGVLQNWEPAAILKFASACAAIKCRQLGNRAPLPTVDDVAQYLAAQPG